MDILISLLCRFLCLSLAVRGRAKCLNGLPQGHRLTCPSRRRGRGRALRAICWRLSSHIESQAREAEIQIPTDVSRRDTLAEILEPVARFLRSHSSQFLNL